VEPLLRRLQSLDAITKQAETGWPMGAPGIMNTHG
jgi:hypothetical protein